MDCFNPQVFVKRANLFGLLLKELTLLNPEELYKSSDGTLLKSEYASNFNFWTKIKDGDATTCRVGSTRV